MVLVLGLRNATEQGLSVSLMEPRCAEHFEKISVHIRLKVLHHLRYDFER